MAVRSPSSFEASLDINDLEDVLQLLKKCDFPDKKWMELGLKLGLKKNTLDAIEENYPRDVSRCLIECLSKWLKRADAVDSKGGATWDTLSTGLRSINEVTVVDMLDQEIQKRSQVLAIGIFDRHHPVLFESLSDPINVARLLYADAVISQQLLSSVEADDLSLADQRQVLLNAMREAVETNHVHLQTFAIVLGKFRHNAKLGDNILGDYGIKFSNNENIESVQVEEGISGNETNGTASPSPKIVTIPVLRSKSKEFSTMRASYAKMSYNVCKAIKAANLDLEDLKAFIISYDSSLEKKLDHCDSVSSVLSVIDKECSLVDVTLFCAVVENFEVVQAENHIKDYQTISKDFCHSVSIALCLKEKLKAIEKCEPSLQSDTVTYVFDWRPDEGKLKDIKDILSETSGKLVRIEYIDSSNSITVTCTFPHSLTGVLIARVMENMQLLKDNGLMRLAIGYWTIWEKEKSQKENELPQEQDVIVPTYSDDMATPPTDPEGVTSKELLDGVVEHLHAVLDVQQAYEQRLTKLQQNNEEVKSLLREFQGKIEENKKDSEKSKAQATLEYYKNKEAKLQKKGEKYRERLYQRFQEYEGETLQKKLVSLEERNRQLQQRLSDHEHLYSQSIKTISVMTMKNKEKDWEIKMLTDELQQQLEKEDLHINMEEELDSEATQSDDQHTERAEADLKDVKQLVSKLIKQKSRVLKEKEEIDASLQHKKVVEIELYKELQETAEKYQVIVDEHHQLEKQVQQERQKHLKKQEELTQQLEEYKLLGQTLISQNKVKISHLEPLPEEKKISFTLSIKGPDLSVPISSLKCSLVPVSKGDKPIHTTVTTTSTHPEVYRIHCNPSTSGTHTVKVQVYDVELEDTSLIIPFNSYLHNITPVRTITDLKGPWGVAVSDDGHAIVTEYNGACVTILDNEGKKVKSLGRKGGSGNVQFSAPRGVAITPDNFILVSDGNHRIQKISMDGDRIASVGEEGSGPLQFNEPAGIAISPITGQVYIVDRNNHHIQVLNPDLTFSHSFGSEGSANGQFILPRNIAIDSQGLVYVTDAGNHRIQKFSPDEKFVAQFGSYGSGPGQLNWPDGITIDIAGTGLVYVSEYGNNRVSVFTSDGVFVSSFGRYGSNIDQFNYPHGLAFNREGLLYVCDYFNNRLVVYY